MLASRKSVASKWKDSLRLLAVVLAALIAVSAACTSPRLVEEPPTPTPLPTPAEATKPIFAAKRGVITESVKGNGRVAPTREATLYFEQGGRLRRLRAELNQKVKAGDLLAELETGDLGQKVEQARINLDIAQLGLQRAIANAGAGNPEVKTSAAKIVQAEAARSQAVASLERARTGSTESDLRAADAGIAAGRAAVEKAQAELTKLTAPRSPDEVAAARAAVDKAQSVVQGAQAAYDKIASRPDAAGRPEAVALQAATTDLVAAQARYQIATQPARPEDVRAAQEGVKGAQSALEGAIARRDQLAAGPLPIDVNSAEVNVAAAAAAVDAARADFEAKSTAAAVGQADFDVQVAQKNVEIASVSVRSLEEQLSRAVLKAPFDGVVTSTSGREGDEVKAFAPVAVVADPSAVWITVDFPAPDQSKIAVGQAAVVTLDAFKGQRFDSKVLGLPSVAAGLSSSTSATQPQGPVAKSTIVEFKPPGPVDLGALANVTITTQRKEDVVIVPNQAVRKAGGRTFVQVDAGGGRKREVDVQIGIVTEQETEIVRGIKEGTRVVSQ
jgi:macrolide-specific efflux system membrane fusion protein